MSNLCIGPPSNLAKITITKVRPSTLQARMAAPELVVSATNFATGEIAALDQSIKITSYLIYTVGEDFLDSVISSLSDGNQLTANAVLLTQEMPFYIRSESEGKILSMLEMHPTHLLNALKKFIGEVSVRLSSGTIDRSSLLLFTDAMSVAAQLYDDVSERLDTKTDLGGTARISSLFACPLEEADKITSGPFGIRYSTSVVSS